MKILVTGAAGFIGSHTTDALLAAGHEIAGVDNLRTGREANLGGALRNPNFRFHHANVAEPEVVANLCTSWRPEAIVHLAALVSVPESIANPELNQVLNYDTTRFVADAAEAAGSVRRIVFASSAAVYGDNPDLPLDEDAVCRPLGPYGEAKLKSEHYLLEFATSARIVVRCHRYFNVYGPRQDPSSPYSGVMSRFRDAILAGKSPTILGDGEQTRDFIYVGDIARANLLAATDPQVSSGVANVCTGSAVSLNRLLREMSAITGRPITATYGPARIGDIRHSLGKPDRAVSQFGFRPATGLPEGLAQLLGA